MAGFKFKNVRIESWDFFAPEAIVSSDELEDRLAPVLSRMGIAPGTLDKLSGVSERRSWPRGYAPSVGAAEVAKKLLDASSFDRDRIGAIVSCSVCRDHFEPATACRVHRTLSLKDTAFAFDITNACLGFADGLLTVGSMIESGAIEAGLIVSAENPTLVIENTIAEILRREHTITREEFLTFLPTLTLGCGAAAMLLCHERALPAVSNNRPRLVGGLALTASQHVDLCYGNTDFAICDPNVIEPVMHAEASILIKAAAELGEKGWKMAADFFGWRTTDIKFAFPHQIGRQAGAAFFERMGISFDKIINIYHKFGNMVSVSFPAAFCLGLKEDRAPLGKGDRAAFLSFGSGLNSVFLGLEWN
jgi:3-oxoacyl-[acyl-carrier-protein] synthase-3